MNDSAHLSVDTVSDVTVITFRDRQLIEENVEAMRPEMLRLLAVSSRAFVLNLENVEFLASAALGLIVQVGQKAAAQKAVLAVCGARPAVERLFTGPPHLMRSFPIFPDRDAAIAGLQNHH